jgi:peptidylprolyl isomerase
VRRVLTAALLVPLLATLAACGSSSGGSDSSDAPAAALPTVTGAYGAEPTVAIPSGTPSSTLQTKVLVKGKGAAVASGELVTMDYVAEIWKSAKVFDSSFGSGRTALSLPIGSGQTLPAFDKGLVGQTVGSRVLLVAPPADGYGSDGYEQAGIAGDDTLVFVIDIKGADKKDATAHGTVAKPSQAGLPAVSTAAGKPTIAKPTGTAPTKLVVSPVLVGTGATVKKGDAVVVQYVGIKWADGKTFDSSWDRGLPAGFGIGVGQVIPGWDKGLVGRHVGDRVLLVVPPAEGYGSEGQSSAGISGTDTLVFVVDIVATYS